MPRTRMRTPGSWLRTGFSLATAVVVLGTALAIGAEGLPPAAAKEDSFPPEAVEFFETRVRPVLAESCVKCHGEKKQSSELRLDSRQAVLAGGANGPALVPGQP